MERDPIQEGRCTQPREHGSLQDINTKLVTGLRDISHTMRSLYEGKGSQRRILMILREEGTITQRELTQRLDIQPGSASEVIAKLANAGLVERISNEADRRTADISLTEEGLRQAEAAVEQRQQRHKDMFSVLSEEEKLQLAALLDKINSHWDGCYAGLRRHCGEHRGRGHRPECGPDGCSKGHGHSEREGAHGRHGKHERFDGAEAHGKHGKHERPDGAEAHGRHGDHEGRDESRGCDHDCEHCAHPCGRGRGKR